MQPAAFLETADVETASEDYARRFAGPVGDYFLSVQTEILLSLLQPDFPPGTAVLDVGGGHAQLAVPLTEQGYKVTVTGSDASCGQRLARLLPAGSYAYQTCDSLQLPFPDSSFAVVTAFRLLPHVARWPQLLAELARVAARAVIVDYPDSRSVNFLNSLLFRLKKSLEGNTRTFTIFSRTQLLQACAGNGLGSMQLRPEFLLPMVLHRRMGRAGLSRFLERCCRFCGLTRHFGSPIVLRADKQPGCRHEDPRPCARAVFPEPGNTDCRPSHGGDAGQTGS